MLLLEIVIIVLWKMEYSNERIVLRREIFYMRLKAYWYYGKKVCGMVEADNRQELKSEILKALFEGGQWNTFGRNGDKIEIVEE